MTFDLYASLRFKTAALTAIDIVRLFGREAHDLAANVIVPVRVPGPQAGRLEPYFLPSIARGGCDLAIEHVDKLVRQSRLTPEHGAQVIACLRTLAELAR